MSGGIEDVVRAYEGEDAARHVREVLEETQQPSRVETPLAQRASGDE
jgi:ABC-2 type transport system ATP-binding protein